MYYISSKLVSIYQRSISTHKIAGLIERLSCDPKLKKDHDFLIDMRPLDYTPVASDISNFSEIIISIRDKIKGRIAIIASKGVQYDLFLLSSRMMNDKGLQSAVFTDEIRAISWLEMDPSFC